MATVRRARVLPPPPPGNTDDTVRATYQTQTANAIRANNEAASDQSALINSMFTLAIGATVTLAMISPTGTPGSLTFNSSGILTDYIAPT